MAKQATVPADISGGEHPGGDAAGIPPNAVRRLRNVVFEDGSWVSRQAFTYDELTNVRGLGLWYDVATDTYRAVAVNSSGNFFAKASSGETWGSASATAAGASRVAGHANYKGRNYVMLDDGSTGAPSQAIVYDGVDVSATPFNTALAARSIALYKERLFLGAPRLSITVVGANVPTSMYDWTSPTRFVPTNITVRNETLASGVTVCRLYPTSTAVNGCSIYARGAATSPEIGFVTNVPAATTETFHMWRFAVRGTDANVQIPFTIEWILRSDRDATGTYAIGDIVSEGGYIYRCSVAGTSAGAVLSTTKGATTVDGGVLTWITIDTEIVGSLESYVDTVSESPDFSVYYLRAKVPPRTNQVRISPRLKMYNSGQPALTTLAAIEISLKDGKTDGDLSKANRGQQWTAGDYEYPFLNKDATATGTIDFDGWVWSEPFEPKVVRGQNTYSAEGHGGLPTATVPVGGRLIGFKRRAYWTFVATENPDIPILAEGGEPSVGVGCVGPRAWGVHENTLYFIGENGFYRMKAGGEPEELCGQAMLRRVFNKAAASWVESQAAPANRALLTIDQENHRVHLYTQKGVIFIYDIRQETWSEMDAGGDTSVSPTGYQVCDMIYNPTTGNVYVAFSTAATGTAGLARLDDTQAASTDQISSSGTLPVYFDTWFRPIEGHPRADMAVDFLRAEIQCSVSGQSATAYVSMDQGATFTATSTPRDLATTPSNYGPERFVIAKAWGTIMPRLLVSGKAGTRAFRLSGVSFDIRTQKAPETQKR